MGNQSISMFFPLFSRNLRPFKHLPGQWVVSSSGLTHFGSTSESTVESVPMWTSKELFFYHVFSWKLANKSWVSLPKKTHTWHLFFFCFLLKATCCCSSCQKHLDVNATSKKNISVGYMDLLYPWKKHFCKTQTACKTRTSHHLDQRATYKAGWDCRDLGGVS